MRKNILKIALFDAKPYDRVSFEKENLNYGFEISFFESRLTEKTAKLAAGCDCVCAFVNDELDRKVIDILSSCGIRIIAMRCAGYNNVDLREACTHAIPVVRVPQYSPHAVAEYALALLLTLNRKIHRAFNRVREGNFSISGLMGFDLHGKTIGIIGTGKIGRTFAEILQGFGVRLLAYDPFPDEEEAKRLSMKYVPLETLFRESDVISLHAPLTPENTRFINESAISKMKDGVVILNTSRGKLIHSQALIEGLKSGKIGAAGLDVYEEETEYFFEDRSDTVVQDDILARLMTFSNVIVTSHQAFFTKEAVSNIAQTTLESLNAFAYGKKLETAIPYKCGGVKNCPGKKPGEKCIPPEDLRKKVSGLR